MPGNSFHLTGILLGCLILFFTATLFSLELGRLFTGSNTRGENNSADAYQYLIYPNQVIGYNGNLNNPKVENRWVWPWSTATLLFSLIFFLTGAVGLTSGQRESYSAILTFFICSILSTCLIVFLIATYATIIAGWKSIYGNNLPNYQSIDQRFSIACLAISCLLLILFAVSLVLAGYFINICTPKPTLRSRIQYGVVLAGNTPLMRPRTPLPVRRTPGMMRRIPPKTPRLLFN